MERIQKSFTEKGYGISAIISANEYTRQMLIQKYEAVSVEIKGKDISSRRVEEYTITVVYEKRKRPKLRKIDAICSCVSEIEVVHKIGRKDCLGFGLFESTFPNKEITYGGVILY